MWHQRVSDERSVRADSVSEIIRTQQKDNFSAAEGQEETSLTVTALRSLRT